MSKRLGVLALKFLVFILFCGLIFGIFYSGILFERGVREGFWQSIKVQGINVFFGIIGGLITTAVLWLLKHVAERIKFYEKDSTRLTGLYDEEYKSDKFPEPIQEQNLLFNIKHKGERITGTITGTGNPDCTTLTLKEKKIVRLFAFEGYREGSIVSIAAKLDLPNDIGHTVYLLNANYNSTILEGISIYYDTSENVITTSKSVLRRREALPSA